MTLLALLISLWFPCTYQEKGQVSVPYNFAELELFGAKIFRVGWVSRLSTHLR